MATRTVATKPGEDSAHEEFSPEDEVEFERKRAESLERRRVVDVELEEKSRLEALEKEALRRFIRDNAELSGIENSIKSHAQRLKQNKNMNPREGWPE